MEQQQELKLVEHTIPLDILSDLLSRFIINVPQTAKQNHVRVCFQIELAYWYYLDFYVANDTKLRGCTFREFAAHVYQHLPFLQGYYDQLPQILEQWREYKQSVPTYGAIILSEANTHVLLVQSYWAKTSWGFPKGKVNEDEDPAHCAIREVYEETGFDITPHLDASNYFESVINEQLIRLYVVSGVARTTQFRPRTRNEIKACKWFPVAELPNYIKPKDGGGTPKPKTAGCSRSAFFMVMPFVKRIKALSKQRAVKAIQQQQPQALPSQQQQQQHHQPTKSKRQLMFDDADDLGGEFVFSAPSWLNFKFDKAAIMNCLP